jgi:hypothetical protein
MLDKITLKNTFQAYSPILYKLSGDSLLILLFFFVMALIAEGLLPGIISNRIGLYAIVMLLCANLFFTITLANQLAPSEKNIPHQKIIGGILVILAFLIFNALLSLSLPLNLFLLLLSGATIYYIIRVLQEEK